MVKISGRQDLSSGLGGIEVHQKPELALGSVDWVRKVVGMIHGRYLPLLLIPLLPSCAKIGKLVSPGSSLEKPTQVVIPPHLRSGARGGTPVVSGGNATTLHPSMMTAPEDIVWTDPDNPDAGIPELATLMTTPRRGHWETDASKAGRLAAMEGKPIVMLFTDSARNPASKLLAEELLVRKDFDEWCNAHVIRVQIDTNPSLGDSNLSLTEEDAKRERLEQQMEVLKKRYKVLGFPAFLVLTPGGETIGRYNGFKRGDADYTFGLLKQGYSLAAPASKKWQEDLSKKGYRVWQDRAEKKKIFARLLSYSKGNLMLVEPDGRRSQTSEHRLSASDRDWIRHEKLMRGIE